MRMLKSPEWRHKLRDGVEALGRAREKPGAAGDSRRDRFTEGGVASRVSESRVSPFGLASFLAPLNKSGRIPRGSFSDGIS